MDIVKLKAAYELYGYKIDESNTDIIIFLFEEGRYFGADIVPLTKDQSLINILDSIREEFSEAGYAAQIKNYENVEDAEIELYKSFFSYSLSKKRAKLKYDTFVGKLKKLNGGIDYEYIESPYTVNGIDKIPNGIISSITDTLKSVGSQLVIIEAAAGYGKTCTSHELFKSFISSNSCEIPLITELSRNRGANIFRYILLDEIDRVYPNLDSKLVKYEIQSGRIPLIIDGFDELLKRSSLTKSDKKDVFEEVETMLDTIGNLLRNNAKIILTTRKTAIFSGVEFKKWSQKWEDKFEIIRYSIDVPKIKDWIGKDKLEKVKENEIPVEYIANPVLLTYLKSLSFKNFETILLEPESIVKTYFRSLLKREMERQELHINPDDQYEIFKNTVKILIQMDTSSESQAFFKDLIYEENKELLDRTLKLYPSISDISVITGKLANHALLDRKSFQSDQVSFINDFVFGSFIGEIMSESSVDEINKNWSSYMVELGITAFKVQNTVNKSSLWDKINLLEQRFEPNSLFNFDITLKNALMRKYDNTEFNSLNIFNIKFNSEHQICQSVFIDCSFKKCHFEEKSITDVTFLNCYFSECTTEGNKKLEELGNIKTINCREDKTSILSFAQKYILENNRLTLVENKILLEIYEGENNINRILKSLGSYNMKEVNQALNKLNDQHFIEINSLTVNLATNKIKTIKHRLNIK